MSCGAAEGSISHDPGAIRPSSLRWSSPMALTAWSPSRAPTAPTESRCLPRHGGRLPTHSAVTVEVHTGRVGNQGEDAVGDRVGLDVLDVVELASFGNDQLAHPVLRIGQPRNGIRRRYLGAHLVEAGLDRRRSRSCPRRQRRRPSTVATTLCSSQGLADRGRGVAVVDLNDHIRHPVAGVVTSLRRTPCATAWSRGRRPRPRSR